MTPEETEVITELGSKEVEERIANLPRYERYEIVARIGDTYGHRDAPLSPAEARAFTKLAEALDMRRYPLGVLVDGLTLVTPVTTDALHALIAQREIRDRQAAEAQDA